MPWFNWRRPLRPVFLRQPADRVPPTVAEQIAVLDTEIAGAKAVNDLGLMDELIDQRLELAAGRPKPLSDDFYQEDLR